MSSSFLRQQLSTFTTLIIWAYASSSCSLPKHESRYPIVAEDSSISMLKKLTQQYPKEFKMVHRVILKINDREFDFNGYLLVDSANRTLHASAFAEAGSAVFEFSKKGSSVEIQRKPEMLADDSIKHGILEDLLHIYGQLQSDDGTLVEKTQQTRTFSFVKTETRANVDEYTMDKDLGLQSSLSAIDGRIVRRVSYDSHKKLDDWPTPIPNQLSIDNLEFDYTAQMTVVDFSTKLPEAFKAKQVLP